MEILAVVEILNAMEITMGIDTIMDVMIIAIDGTMMIGTGEIIIGTTEETTVVTTEGIMIDMTAVTPVIDMTIEIHEIAVHRAGNTEGVLEIANILAEIREIINIRAEVRETDNIRASVAVHPHRMFDLIANQAHPIEKGW